MGDFKFWVMRILPPFSSVLPFWHHCPQLLAQEPFSPRREEPIGVLVRVESVRRFREKAADLSLCPLSLMVAAGKLRVCRRARCKAMDSKIQNDGVVIVCVSFTLKPIVSLSTLMT